jgi:hypothetical protein
MAGKISIIGQIAEVDREIAERQKLYPRLVREVRMKEEQRVMLMDRIIAIRATLMFCREHEADIRAWMAEKKGGRV